MTVILQSHSSIDNQALGASNTEIWMDEKYSFLL
jgi:hypothetical protein